MEGASRGDNCREYIRESAEEVMQKQEKFNEK